MTQFNPKTPVIAVAKFTLGGGPGKFKAGSCVWSGATQDGSPSTDVITQVDDPENGVSTATIDGSSESDGNVSTFTCTANGNVGGGDPSLVSATSDPAEWTAAADIEADGETIGMSQSAPATRAQTAVHAKAQAKR